VIFLFDESGPPEDLTRNIALLGSGAFHVLILIVLALVPGHPKPLVRTHLYRIQLLHLDVSRLPSFRPTTLRRAALSKSAQHQPLTPRAEEPEQEVDTTSLAKNKGPQTLIVPEAPSEVKLRQPVPLPFALSWQALEEKSAKRTPTRGPVTYGVTPSPPAIENSVDPAATSPLNWASSTFTLTPNLPVPPPPAAESLRPPHERDGGLPLPAVAGTTPAPKANILALPDTPATALQTLVVPKVSQSSEASRSEGTSLANHPNPDQVASNPAASQTPPARTPPDQSPTSPAIPPVEAKPEDATKLTRIERSRSGNFKVSTMGSSVSDEFPDVDTDLAGKVVSTVYLDVGLRKSWILEFSEISSGGAPVDGTPLDPPYPYLIFVPRKLQLPEEAEAALISGRINTKGEFENLHLLLPAEWEQKEYLTNALGLWSFRPAAHHDKPVAINILLVIRKSVAE
jgi:hypothetical protein